MVKRIPIGAHYGLRDWLAQRITAVIMILYTLLWLIILILIPQLDYATWRGIFARPSFKVVTFLFLLSLYWHAWVGMRDIIMDYVKPVAWRLTSYVFVLAAIVIFIGWSIHILWGLR